METMGVNLEANTKVTLTEVDASKVGSFLGTDKIEDKSITDGFQSLPETIGNSTDEWKANTAIMKEFGNAMPELVKSLRQMNDAVIRNTQTLPSLVPAAKKTSDDLRKERIDALNRQNILGFFNTGSNMIQGAANGNVGSSLISGVSGMSSTVNNLSQMANVSEMTNLAKGLMVGGGVLMAGAAVLKGGKALADAYKDAMPTIFGTGKAFGTTDDNMSMALYKQVNKYNEGTNLDNAAFNSLVVNLRKQGVGNNLTSPYSQVAEAGRIAETTAQWAYKTGGDANQFANLAGIMSRYGGSINVADDFNRLVSAGYASGLNDSQIPEFLSGIQKVMEDGIAKGFSRSATEVADTMLMFSKLSGNNAFWQGEQGAKLINQASAGLAGATAMSKTTDLIAFGAINRAFSTPELMEGALGKDKDLYMKGSNYVNEMMILEQGLNKDNFGALMGGIYSTSADDDDRVEDIRSMFGLNYTGARRMQRLYEEYQNKGFDDATFESKLKEITDSPENQNDETAYRKSVNKIAEALQTMGQPVFNLELTGIQNIEGLVSKIEKFLSIDYENKLAEQEASEILNNLTDDQMSYYLSSPDMQERAKDPKKGLEDLKNLQSWNGFGRLPNINDDRIFNNDVGDNFLMGTSGEGAWGLDKTIKANDKDTMYDFLKLGFGEEILSKFGGNEKNADYFLKILSESPKAADFRTQVQKRSEDKDFTKEDQNKTLDLIYKLLKEGITMN